MKTILNWLIMVSAILLVSCSDDSTTTTPPTDPPVTLKYGIVSGKVFDLNGSALEGVTVKIKDKSTKTNEQGWFYIDKVVVETNESVISFEKYIDSVNNTAYIPNIKKVQVIENTETHLPSTKLLQAITEIFPSTQAQAININVGGTEVGSANFDANTFVTAAGNAYRGNVKVEISGFLPTDPNFYDVFPGGFNGQDSAGINYQLISLGFMTINATDGSKNKLQIAPGKTAKLKMKATSKFRDLQTVPMWYLDETTGIWKKEGRSTRTTDGYFEANVQHLSSWNWDIIVDQDRICIISGKVVMTDNSPVPNAIVRGEGTGSTFYYDQTYTDAEGKYSMRALKNSTIALGATIGTYASSITNQVIGNNATQTMPDLVVTVPLLTAVLTWGLNPRDLDSHLFVPPATKTPYHIYYSNTGSISQYPFAFLDTDDTQSYGPEIITAFKLYPGTYKYFIHHYSGDSTLATSQGKVIVNLRGSSSSITVPTTQHTPAYIL